MKDDHPTIATLHKATYDMLLFGIPHRGLVIDDIQKMLAGQDNHPRTDLLNQIKQKSDNLVSQLDDFKNLIRDRKVVSFYEMAQTRQLQFVRRSDLSRTQKAADVFVIGQREQTMDENWRFHHCGRQRVSASPASGYCGRQDSPRY